MESSTQTQEERKDRPAETWAPWSLRLDVLISAVLMAVVLAVFAQVLGNGFVQWDDDIMVTQNPHIQGLDLERLRWMFTDVAYTLRYKPLTWLGYAVLIKLWGLQPLAFHLVALLFHAANTVLVYWLLRKLALTSPSSALTATRPWRVPLAAALAALVWAVHPLRVEPVARATDLTYDQSLFFCLVSLLCYLRAAELGQMGARRLGWQIAAVIGYALAMLTYPFIAGYVAILLVLDVGPLRRLRLERNGLWNQATRAVWREKIPYLLLAGLAFMTWLGRSHPTGMWTLQEHRSLGLLAKAMQAFYVWIYYLARPWWPFDLSPVYTTLVDFSPVSWRFLSSATLVVGLTVFCLWGRKRYPIFLALWLCHLVLLVPALGLTESPHYTCDRYHHVAAILWSVLILFGLLRLGPRAWPGAVAVLLALTVLLSSLTRAQVRVWRDSESLFKHMIATLGNDPYRAIIHRKLGAFYAESGHLDQAVEQSRLSLSIRPGSLARLLLADTLVKQGKLEEAIAQYREETQRNPGNAGAHGKAGYLLARLARSGEAVAELKAALRLQPDSVSDLNLLAWILATDATAGNAPMAVRLAEKACALTGHRQAAFSLTLGTAYLKAGRLADAEKEAETAISLAASGRDANLLAKCRELQALVAQAKAAAPTGSGLGNKP
jgi:protein O-mannosyl-transferase